MEISTLKGQQINPYLDEVAKLRMEIFRDWPYLYEGDIDIEKNYLKVYSDSEDSILVCAKDNNKVVGLAIGLPAKESIEEVQDAFNNYGSTMDKCYYFADAILLERYRGKKVGLKMIQTFENAVESLGKYDWIYFCEIVRDTNDPRLPSDYNSLDPFWEGLGYNIMSNWQTSIDWVDIGEKKKSPHNLRFRRKPL